MKNPLRLNNSYHSIKGEVSSTNFWYDFFLNTLVELGLNRFKWKNLPDTIDPRYLELSLMLNGSVIFFYDYLYGYKALTGTYTGIDMEYNPTDYHVVTPTGFSPNIKVGDGIIIWNNFTRCSDMPTIQGFASAIAEIYTTALINVRSQKHPIVVVVPEESERLSYENAYAKLDGNHPVIYLKKKSNLVDNFTTINAQVPFIGRELLSIARMLTEEVLKWYGIKVPNVDKKERQITIEQTDKNAVTYQLRNRGLHSRQVAAESINKRFGINIEVEFDEEAEYYGEMMLNSIGGSDNE